MFRPTIRELMIDARRMLVPPFLDATTGVLLMPDEALHRMPAMVDFSILPLDDELYDQVCKEVSGEDSGIEVVDRATMHLRFVDTGNGGHVRIIYRKGRQ